LVIESQGLVGEAVEIPTKATTRPASNSPVYASGSGTKYYFPWCSGYSSIKKENLKTFISEGEAISAGYEKAKNCSSTEAKGEKR